MSHWQEIPGGVTAPRGYRAAGVAAGLKPSGALDLALIVSDVAAIAAGVFTTSQVRAACVDYCRQRLHQKANAQAILCNAGQANAATGDVGKVDVLTQARLTAASLNIAPEAVLVASTGVIGQPIAMDKLETALPHVVEQLSSQGSEQAANAILTTDLVTKSIALEAHIGDRPVRIGGIAKGSGMIHPNMATLLAFVTCDAAVSPHLWQQMISHAAEQSFNQITVDGDTSTNDMLLALANGQSRTPAITEIGPEAKLLQAMLTQVCIHLAKAIARDGEGATCLIEVQVSGTPDNKAARLIARTIAGSMLFKSAIFGRDPNWGRIAAAAGRAGVPFQQEKLYIRLGDFVLMENGTPQAFDRAAASNYLQQDPVIVTLRVGDGSGQGTAWGCDLSYDYVKINAEYTT